MVKNSEVVSYCRLLLFFLVVVAVVELAVAEEGVVLRRGPLVLCPFRGEECYCVDNPFDLDLNQRSPRRSPGHGEAAGPCAEGAASPSAPNCDVGRPHPTRRGSGGGARSHRVARQRRRRRVPGRRPHQTTRWSSCGTATRRRQRGPHRGSLTVQR
jgi:hypothetical protein